MTRLEVITKRVNELKIKETTLASELSLATTYERKRTLTRMLKDVSGLLLLNVYLKEILEGKV